MRLTHSVRSTSHLRHVLFRVVLRWVCRDLSCLILSCLVLYCLVMSCLALSCLGFLFCLLSYRFLSFLPCLVLICLGMSACRSKNVCLSLCLSVLLSVSVSRCMSLSLSFPPLSFGLFALSYILICYLTLSYLTQQMFNALWIDTAKTSASNVLLVLAAVAGFRGQNKCLPWSWSWSAFCLWLTWGISVCQLWSVCPV
jgi:hypothetical protein